MKVPTVHYWQRLSFLASSASVCVFIMLAQQPQIRNTIVHHQVTSTNFRVSRQDTLVKNPFAGRVNETAVGNKITSDAKVANDEDVFNETLAGVGSLTEAGDDEYYWSQPRPKYGQLNIQKKIDPQAHPPKISLKSQAPKNPLPSLVFGIPTVDRGQNFYLPRTLNSLLKHLNPKEFKEVLFVIMIAELNESNAERILRWFNSTHQKNIDRGLFEVIVVNHEFYPNINTDSEINETRDRVFWRSKQTLDAIYLMNYCRSRGKYYIHLEDDVITRPGYVASIKTYADKMYKVKLDQTSKINWVFLNFCPMGFIGKLFVAEELEDFITYMILFWNDWPCDWLLHNYLRNKSCAINMKSKACLASAKAHNPSYSPPLFQHIGLHSSLKGKISKEKLKRFPDIGAGFKSMVGGEIKGMSKLTKAVRTELVQEATEIAKRMGANAITGIRIETNSIYDGMLDIVLYGTAVLAHFNH